MTPGIGTSALTVMAVKYALGMQNAMPAMMSSHVRAVWPTMVRNDKITVYDDVLAYVKRLDRGEMLEYPADREWRDLRVWLRENMTDEARGTGW